MVEKFDPYRKWLGIPPAEQPADHYRLLGIGRFEDDADTISNAADRQMAHVRTFQAGSQSAVSQKLLNEIAAARVCLLNSSAKAEYDARLRARDALQASQSQLAAPVPGSQPAPWSAAAMAVPPAVSPLSPRRTTRKTKSRIAWLAAGGVLALAVIAALVILARKTGETYESQPLAGEYHPAADSTGVAPANREQTDAAETESASAAPRDALPKAKLEIIAAKWGKDDRWEDITERVQSLVHDERLVVSAWGSFFLGLHDPAFGEGKQIQIQYRSAGESRTAQFADGDFIYLDGHPPETREPSTEGLEVLDARYGAGSTWGDVLPRVRRWLHGDRLAVRVDLVAPNDPAPGVKKALFLRYRTGDGEFVAHAWDGEELVLDARPIATNGKPTDLIAKADPEHNSTGGRWQKDGETLVAPDKEAGSLAIPVSLPEEYSLKAVVEGSPLPSDVGVTLPVEGRHVQLLIDGAWRSASGLQNVDGAVITQNSATRRGTICEPGQETFLECAVRRGSVYARCNGRVVADWRGDPSRLSLPGGAAPPEKPTIVLANLGNPWRLSRLQVAPLGREPSSPAPADGNVIDLLKLIDPKLDAVWGDWEMSDKGLLTASGDGVRLQVPYRPPDDYELRLVVERTSGNDAFFVGFIVDGRQTMIVIDGWNGGASGLHFLDGETAEHNVTRHSGRVFVDERPKELVVTVHPSSVRATCEGQMLVDWHGDARRLSVEPRLSMPDELGLALADWNTKFLVSKFELRPLPPEAPEKPVDLAQPMDLLKRIDPKRDAVAGDWKKEGGALLAPAGHYSRLQLPVLPPEEYELTIDVFGSRDVDLGIVVGARRVEGQVVGGRQVEVIFDGFQGHTSGLNLVNGKPCNENPTIHQGKVLRDDGPNQIVCTVRQNRVEVLCNGRPVVDWQGDPSTLSLSHEGMMPDDRRLFLRCWEWPYRVTRLELSAPGAKTPETAPAAPAEKPPSLADLLDKPSADKLLPAPSGKDLLAAEKKVAEMFDPHWKAAKKFADRLAVARNLYNKGIATVDDPTLRYALLREASVRAAGLGDASTACDALDALGREFQLDALAEKLTLVSEALSKARQTSQIWTLAIHALLLSDRAVADERFEEARKFASLAAAAGRRTRSHDVADYAERRLARVRGRQEEYARLGAALERLAEQPDDPAANRTAGLDLCLLHGDWQRGLPLLARSGDVRLVEIARLETAAANDVSQRAALVDAWLAEAEHQTGSLRDECQLQAKYWVDRGLPSDALGDEKRKAALAKLAGLPAISQARLVPGLDMAMFDGGDFQQFRARRVDAQICHHFGHGSPHPSVPGDYFSIRWTGWIKPPLPGTYIIKTSSDDSIRVRINNKQVIDHWNRGAGDEAAEVELTDALQPLVVEYNDYTDNADVCLSWALKGFSDLQVVPAEALFHDPAKQQ